MSQPDTLLALPAVVRITSLSRATIYRLSQRDKFPKPIKISENRIAWPAEAVAAWVASKLEAA